jgi:hypothetical protein
MSKDEPLCPTCIALLSTLIIVCIAFGVYVYFHPAGSNSVVAQPVPTEPPVANKDSLQSYIRTVHDHYATITLANGTQLHDVNVVLIDPMEAKLVTSAGSAVYAFGDFGNDPDLRSIYHYDPKTAENFKAARDQYMAQLKKDEAEMEALADRKAP